MLNYWPQAIKTRTQQDLSEAILDMYLLDHLGGGEELTRKWLFHYNYERPHQALGMQPPIMKTAAWKWNTLR